ncbi:hypothetical protein [Neoroseomonas soli]|uniref:Uncharacterized protein n=1 Tax=Neoroseomonas soli TaxID=1081025 RepID=A0A9X9WSJ5_9PROT|nr:hypothetical protein [Neoroseomonas soli]MBR0670124.1 hypothetical protein [Neoroseomonas soli]
MTATLLRMATETPGAAFAFASTLRRACVVANNKRIPVEQRLTILDQGIAEAMPDAGADGGTSVLAVRFARALVLSETGSDIGHVNMARAVTEICNLATSYRGVEARDHLAPKDESARRILAKQGLTCLAEMADAVRRKNDELGLPPETATADLENLFALMDIREEASSGPLFKHLADIERALDFYY